jgi:hypothetical protein
MQCQPDYYQNKPGQDACFSCSSSSSSGVAATTCTCEGQNRIFQPQDGWCICKPGYEYVNADLEVSQEGDGVYDCQPIVYDRCANGLSRSSDGDCVDPDSFCVDECGDTGGTFLESGVCECNGLETLDEICDEDCRAASLKTRCIDGKLETYDPVTDEAVFTDLEDFETEGSIDCSTDGASILSMGTTDGTFSGTFGAGEAISNYISRRRLKSARSTLPEWLRNKDFVSFDHIDYYKDLNFTHQTGTPLMYHTASRNLANVSATNSSGVIENPIVCINLGDSLVFDVTNDNYPQYDKDSLFNSNDNYDYSAFRSLESSAKSQLTISTFSTTFDESGTYSFRMSSAKNKQLIVAVMPANVNCSLESFFVTFSASNLITLGIDTTDDIVLSPDWDLVLGLLGGMLGLVLILIGFLYFFRKRAWTTHKDIQTKYRSHQRGAKKESSKGGHMTKGDKEKKGGSAIEGFGLNDSLYEEVCLEDLEAAALANESAAIEFDDDMMVPELAAHMQKNHDGIDRQMHIQNDRLSEIAESLKREVDDIKSMIVTTAQGGGGGALRLGNNPNKLNAVLSRLRADITQRTVYEHGLQGTEARLNQVLLRLQNLLDEGPTIISCKIVDEIFEQSEVAYQQNDLVNPATESLLLHEMIQDLEDVKDYIDISLSQAIDAEERRRKNAESIFDSNLRDSNLSLSQAILTGVKKCSSVEHDIDMETAELMKAFRAFSVRSPKFITVMVSSEVELGRELIQAMDVGNPSQCDSSKEKSKDLMENYLHDLWTALKALLGKVKSKTETFVSSRHSLEMSQMELSAAIDEFLAENPVSDHNEEALMKLLQELRSERMIGTGVSVSESIVAQLDTLDDIGNVTVSAPLISIIEEEVQSDKLADMQDHIEDEIMQRENFSVDIKEELIGGSESDANVINSIIEQEHEHHLEALRHMELNTDQSESVVEEDEAMALKHQQEAEELKVMLEKEHNANLNALMRTDGLDGASDDEKKLQSFLSARYAVQMRLHGMNSRQLFAELNADFTSQRNAVLKSDPGADVTGLYQDEKQAMSDLLKELAARRASIADEEDALRVTWEADLSNVDLDACCVDFVKETELKFTDLKERINDFVPVLREISIEETSRRVAAVEKRITHFSDPVRQECLINLQCETKQSQEDATMRVRQHVKFLEATKRDIDDILGLAMSWERTPSQRGQQSELHERVITALYSYNDGKSRLSQVENSLIFEAKEMKLFSDLNKLGTTEVEVTKFIRDQRESDALSASYLQKQASIQGQKVIALAKERHESAVIDHEKELAYATEMNCYRQFEFAIEADLSRSRALTEVKTALAAKRGYLITVLRDKNLPEYIMSEASLQVDAEIQREECELDAAYFSMLSSLTMSQMHAAAMVEAQRPDFDLVTAWIESSFTKEVTSYRESFGNEIERKMHKTKVQAHALAESEAERLMLLGRSSSDLDTIHATILDELESTLATIVEDVTRDWRRMEQNQMEQHKDKIQIQQDYEAKVKAISQDYENARNTMLQTLNDGKQTMNTKDFENLEVTTAAAIATIYRRMCTDLWEAFKVVQTQQLCFEQSEDNLRDLRNKKQQESEAVENSFDIRFEKSAHQLTKKQTKRRDDLNELHDEYERSLLGLEEQFKLQRAKAQKFLQQRLQRERERRERELMAKGQSASQAKQHAKSECEAYEVEQQTRVDKTMKEKEDSIRSELFSAMTQKVSDAERRKKLLKESIPNGLDAFRKKERKAKEADLVEQARVFEKALIDEGMNPQTAKVTAQERLEGDRQVALATLTASQEPVQQMLTEALISEAAEEVQHLRDGWPISQPRHELQRLEEEIQKRRDDAIASLTGGLNELTKKKRAELKVSFDEARREAQRGYTENGMNPVDAAAAAKNDLSSGEQKGIEELDLLLKAIKERLENAVDRNFDDKLLDLKHAYAKSCDGLEFALQVKQAAHKKAFQARLDKRRGQRREALAAAGVPDYEIDERVASEFANSDSLLNEVLNDMREDMLNEQIVKGNKLIEMEDDTSAGDDLAIKEDDEARALRMRLHESEESFIKQKELDSFSASDAARSAAKESYGHTEALIQARRDVHAAAIEKLEKSSASALEKERKSIELQHDLQVADVQASKLSKSEKAKKIIDIEGETDIQMKAIEATLQQKEADAKFKLNKQLEDDIMHVIDSEHEKAQKASEEMTAAMNSAMEKVSELQKMQESELQRLQEQLIANQRAMESELKDKVLKKKTVEEESIDALRDKLKAQEMKALRNLDDRHAEELASLLTAANDPNLDEDSRRLALEKVALMRKEQSLERKRLEDKLLSDRHVMEKALKKRLAQKREDAGVDKAVAVRHEEELQDELDAKAMQNLKIEQDAELAILLAIANDPNLDENSRRVALDKVERMRQEHDIQRQNLQDMLRADRDARQQKLKDRIAKRLSNPSLSDEEEEIEAVFESLAEHEECDKMEVLHQLKMKHLQEHAALEEKISKPGLSSAEKASLRAQADALQQEQMKERQRLERDLLSSMRERENALAARLAKRRSKPLSAVEEAIAEVIEHGKAQEAAEVQKLEEHHAAELANALAALNNGGGDESARHRGLEQVARMKKEQSEERERLENKLLADRRCREKALKERLKERQLKKSPADKNSDVLSQSGVQDLLEVVHEVATEEARQSASELSEAEEAKLLSEQKKYLKSKFAKIVLKQKAAMKEGGVVERAAEDDAEALKRVRETAQKEQDRLVAEMESKHAEQLQAAMMQARQMEVDAATAAAKEKALEAEKIIKVRLAEELSSQELKRLHEEHERESKKNQEDLMATQQEGKKNLKDRLAEKRLRKEKELREKEETALAELQRKQSAEKEEKEKLRQAKMVWSERLAEAAENADKMGLEGLEKEDFCFKETIGKKLVPESHLSEVAQAIMKDRHSSTMTELLNIQFKNRISAIKDAIERVLTEKAEARIDLVDKLVSRKATDDFIKLSLSDLDTKYSAKQIEAEEGAVLILEREHMNNQMVMRQKQLEEISTAISMYSDAESLAKLSEMTGKSRQDELIEYRNRLETEKKQAEKKMQAEREANEAKLRSEHQKGLDMVKEKLEADRKKEEAVIEEKRKLLLRQKKEFEKKQADESGKLNVQEKQRILEQFEKEIASANEALTIDKKRRKNNLEQRLAARKKKAVPEKKEESVVSNSSPRSIMTAKSNAFTQQVQSSVPLTAAPIAATSPELVQILGVMEMKLGQIDAVMKLQANDSKKLEKMNQLIMSMEGGEGRHHDDVRKGTLTDKFRQSFRRSGSKLGLDVGPDSAPPNIRAIEEKLDRLLQQRNDPEDAKSSAGAVYFDKSNPPQGEEMVPKQKLSVQEKAKMAFGSRLVELVGLPTLQFTAVTSLPPSTLTNNAFKNSYHFDDKKSELFIHSDRLTSSGDFGLVCIHALSHIKVNPTDLSNDNDPKFAAEFYTNLKILSQNLYKNINSSSVSGHPNAPPKERKLSNTQSVSAEGTPPPVSNAEYFNRQRMQERMKMYLASDEGGQGTVPSSFLDRYSLDSEQK